MQGLYDVGNESNRFHCDWERVRAATVTAAGIVVSSARFCLTPRSLWFKPALRLLRHRNFSMSHAPKAG